MLQLDLVSRLAVYLKLIISRGGITESKKPRGEEKRVPKKGGRKAYCWNQYRESSHQGRRRRENQLESNDPRGGDGRRGILPGHPLKKRGKKRGCH